MKLLGLDLGSSFIKGVIVDGDSGNILARAQYPDSEMEMSSSQAGWAEQNPETWWDGIKIIIRKLIQEAGDDIGSIGISYQMHGLVLLDKEYNVVRPSIIWCDSRATTIGDNAFSELGEMNCLAKYLNSPGNFTASKMRWVIENEKETWEKVRYAMLPGDYIALKLSGIATTTPSGLSEMVLWNFSENQPAWDLMDYYEIDHSIIPPIVDTFTDEVVLSINSAMELGIKEGIPIAYRAGDQPNNALSLNVFQPGEVATTAGTSGVIYGVTDKKEYDAKSRVNSFLHVNHKVNEPRYGVLMCVNGAGILNRWAKENFAWEDYPQMNKAAQDSVNSSEINTYPFGNGAERILSNKHPGAIFSGINLNRHTKNDIARSIQEGICFAFNYGLSIMKFAGINAQNMRAGNANMFLSPLFSQTLANVTAVPIELYDTDGAKGAAMASGIGSGYYSDRNDAFSNMSVIRTVEPIISEALDEQYHKWEEILETTII